MKRILTALLVGCTTATLWAQDVHFSQFYNAPLTLNPAMTGLIAEDVRATLNYRSQWGSVTTPYETMAASTDFSILKGQLGDDFVGLGLMVMNDRAGDLGLRHTQVQVSASYSKALNGEGNQYLTAGAQVGVVQRAFDLNNARFDSQYDGITIDPNRPSGEVIDRPNFFHADLSAGLAWFYMPTPKTSFYLGAGWAHLNRPNVSFLAAAGDRQLRKVTLHGGMELPVGASLSIVPQVVFLAQGPHRETNAGMLFKIAMHPDYGVDYGQAAFYVGGMYRIGDAVIPMLRLDISQVSVTASYDFNVSALNPASRSNGGFELSMVYRQFLYDSGGPRGPQGCPTF